MVLKNSNHDKTWWQQLYIVIVHCHFQTLFKVFGQLKNILSEGTRAAGEANSNWCFWKKTYFISKHKLLKLKRFPLDIFNAVGLLSTSLSGLTHIYVADLYILENNIYGIVSPRRKFCLFLCGEHDFFYHTTSAPAPNQLCNTFHSKCTKNALVKVTQNSAFWMHCILVYWWEVGAKVVWSISHALLKTIKKIDVAIQFFSQQLKRT